MRESWELGTGLPRGSQRALEYQKHGRSTMKVGGDLSVHELPARASAELANEQHAGADNACVIPAEKPMLRELSHQMVRRLPG
jgi:hypothetical protein